MKPRGYLLIEQSVDLKSALIAQAVAGEAKVPFFRISEEDFLDPQRFKKALKQINQLKCAVILLKI